MLPWRVGGGETIKVDVAASARHGQGGRENPAKSAEGIVWLTFETGRGGLLHTASVMLAAIPLLFAVQQKQ